MELKNKNVVVVGLAKSGISSIRYLVDRGARVTATDKKSEDAIQTDLNEIRELHVSLMLGKNDPSAFEKADVIVLSPGVPLSLQGLEDASKRGVPIIGDMELAAHEIKKPIIAITGTNGKTTTTALTGHLLESAGIKTVVAGNIGTPILDLLDEANGSDVVVLEVSSFQIETSPSLRPNISVLLNVTPDHLDRHLTMEDYVACKAKLFDRIKQGGVGIYNAVDDLVSQAVVASSCTLVPFDATGRLFSKMVNRGRAWFGDGDLWVWLNDGLQNYYPLKNVSLKGVHNRENMLAALASCESSGADSEKLKRGLESFKGLPHRMEYVGELNGVSFYNDSKGTNVGATQRALEQCAEPVVLIAGGLAKGVSFSSLRPAIEKRVKLLVLIGKSAGQMEREFNGCAEIVRASSMDEAVHKAYGAAVPGDVVLLSPACASFDMFKGYVDRGETFVGLVHDLMNSKKRAGS